MQCGALQKARSVPEGRKQLASGITHRNAEQTHPPRQGRQNASFHRRSSAPSGAGSLGGRFRWLKPPANFLRPSGTLLASGLDPVSPFAGIGDLLLRGVQIRQPAFRCGGKAGSAGRGCGRRGGHPIGHRRGGSGIRGRLCRVSSGVDRRCRARPAGARER